jgi:hypothetical protein
MYKSHKLNPKPQNQTPSLPDIEKQKPMQSEKQSRRELEQGYNIKK